MDSPPELSLAEIHKFMIKHDCKVTNHALVKHFKKFLKNPVTENEARKQFKTYVNILATVVNEKNQKYLLLREKYLYDCPSEDIVNRISSVPSSPGNISINSEVFGSPFRQPPPYKPPPQVLQKETQQNYRDCISEFQAAVRHIDPNRMPINDDLVQQLEQSENFGEISEPPTLPPRKSSTVDQAIVISRNNFHEEENKENVNELLANDPMPNVENQMSVKEATRKFNRMASEEEAKVISPQSKKKPEKEKVLIEDKADDVPEVTISHPKAKEWLVAAAKANYQELAKLGLDYPELARLHDPTTGYTALHWAAKHGNEDVCKLIAGTYKANINARTNGGYTPLHLAMQFGRENIFELLCNVYKANRDITDWSGNKPLDYSKQRTTVSASTYSSEYDILRPTLLDRSIGDNRLSATIKLSKKRSTQQYHPNYATVGHATSSSLFRAQSLMIGGNSSRRLKKDRIKQENIIDDKLKPVFWSPQTTNGLKTKKYNDGKLNSTLDNIRLDSMNSNENNSSDLGAIENDELLAQSKSKTKRKKSFLHKKFTSSASITK